MSKKARFGLILVVALGVGIATVTPITNPHKEKPARTEATADEKRANRATAKAYAEAGWGWRGREWVCLERLWTLESRFDHLAKNQQGSSAYGIAQLLGEKSNRADLQIIRGLRYISHRYGTPCKALRFHLRHNYY